MLLLSLLHGPTSETLALFLVQVFIIITLVRILGRVLLKIRQPMVIGEIIAGILLGPSAFGQIPGFSVAIFPSYSISYLQLFANIGLIFFMFFLGLEVEPNSMKKSLRAAVPVAICSIAVPFAVGAALSLWFYKIETTTNENFTSFLLFLGTSLSFTAFPVLARLLASGRLLSSPLGVTALSCAAVDDLLAWCTLALTLSYANGGGPLNGCYIALIAVGFIVFLLFFVKPFLEYLHNHLLDHGDELNRNFLAILFLGLCSSAWFAEILGIHAFFGSFIFGICVPKAGNLINDLAPKIELLVVEVFLPLYFANSGIRTDITGMRDGSDWGALAVVCVIGSCAKIVPVLFIARASVFYEPLSLPVHEQEAHAAKLKAPPNKLNNIEKDDPVVVKTPQVPLNMIAAAPDANSDNSVPEVVVLPAPVIETNGIVIENLQKSLDEVAQPDVDEEDTGITHSHNISKASSPAAASVPINVEPDVFDLDVVKHRISWRDSLTLGILMNTRGLVALIALNIGLDNGILGTKVFTIMVLFSLITTFITAPALYVLYEKPYHAHLDKLRRALAQSLNTDKLVSIKEEHEDHDDHEGASEPNGIHQRTVRFHPVPVSDEGSVEPVSPAVSVDNPSSTSRERRPSASARSSVFSGVISLLGLHKPKHDVNSPDPIDPHHHHDHHVFGFPREKSASFTHRQPMMEDAHNSLSTRLILQDQAAPRPRGMTHDAASSDDSTAAQRALSPSRSSRTSPSLPPVLVLGNTPPLTAQSNSNTNTPALTALPASVIPVTASNIELINSNTLTSTATISSRSQEESRTSSLKFHDDEEENKTQ